ncbi:PH domain-containing protein [Pseudoglutamicibacter cumminsii]|uniref:PH domain-containing protein n=1 Tax=Pseudoglutamicibacter cumminsii TaxID=156979 RepID=A0AAP4CA05_9MICC|nr:PH domain-containing protein [Pseudoglutamicibacter cumminsii]MDK6274536.1 PH domain-containing protein [Pseudoglutamicibacter cumminsii]
MQHDDVVQAGEEPQADDTVKAQPQPGGSVQPSETQQEPAQPQPWVADHEWIPVDPRLAKVHHLANFFSTVAWAAGGCVPWLLKHFDVWATPTWLVWAGWILVAYSLVSGVVEAFLIGPRVRSMGWMLRENDFTYRVGIILRRVVVVPYGRLQYVDLTSGPLMRRYGLCEVSFKTAAAESSPDIPGLTQADGERLRDELAARGEQKLAGI